MEVDSEWVPGFLAFRPNFLLARSVCILVGWEHLLNLEEGEWRVAALLDCIDLENLGFS